MVDQQHQQRDQIQTRMALALLSILGAIEALLIARLVARLLAARPDNPSIALLYQLTEPLVSILRALDYDQPPFGAALEFSTLVLLLIIPLLAMLCWYGLTKRNQTNRSDV